MSHDPLDIIAESYRGIHENTRVIAQATTRMVETQQILAQTQLRMEATQRSLAWLQGGAVLLSCSDNPRPLASGMASGTRPPAKPEGYEFSS